MPLYFYYLFFAALIASVSVHKKWWGTAVFCILFFLFVLISATFH